MEFKQQKSVVLRFITFKFNQNFKKLILHSFVFSLSKRGSVYGITYFG